MNSVDCSHYHPNSAHRRLCEEGKVGLPVAPPAEPAGEYGWRFRTENPCRHLGEFTGETRDCIYCGGAKDIPLRVCAIFGTCTTDRKLVYREADGTWVHIQFCLACEEYQPGSES